MKTLAVALLCSLPVFAGLAAHWDRGWWVAFGLALAYLLFREAATE